MNEKQVVALMHRIASYFEFRIEKWKLDEWHKILREYDNDEVNMQFDKHLKSDSTEAPKLHLLVSELEKKAVYTKELICVCKFCGSQIATERDLSGIKKHEERCRSVQSLKKVYKKYFNKEIKNEDELYAMEDREFIAKHDQVLRQLLEIPTLTEVEQFCINKYFSKELNNKDIKNIAVTKEIEE